MAEKPTWGPTVNCRTICLPISEENYAQIVPKPALFRQWLEASHRQMPELFPPGFAQGFEMKDSRTSQKQALRIRRIRLRDGTAWSVRPSFVTPGMSGRTEEAAARRSRRGGRGEEVAAALFLRKFGVPFWALANVFGRDAMSWYRLELALGPRHSGGHVMRRVAAASRSGFARCAAGRLGGWAAGRRPI